VTTTVPPGQVAAQPPGPPGPGAVPGRGGGAGEVSATAPSSGMVSSSVPTAASGMIRAGMNGMGLLRTGTSANPQRRRIGEVLVEQGVINEEQLQALLAEQAQFLDPKRRPRLSRARWACRWST